MTPTVTNEPFHTEEYPRGSFTTLMNTKVTGCQTVRFTTTYRPDVSGSHYLSFSGLGPSKLFINDELVAEQTEPTKDAMGFLLGVQDELHMQYPFEAGKPYNITITTHPSPTSNAELYLLDAQISTHLGLIRQSEMDSDILAEATALAREADLAIVFVGNTTQWETEGQDLSTMTLPAPTTSTGTSTSSQNTLIAHVAAANPHATIVVATTGVPVETPWLPAVPAFLQAWYAGQETGNAILDVLLGHVCPSGKLPVSWPQRYEDTGCYGHFGLDSFESRQVEYVEGVFVGYRWFDELWGGEREVRFPFGFGLSYTSFNVSDAQIEGSVVERDGDDDGSARVKVSAKVKNTGPVTGAETVQVYLAPPPPPVVPGGGTPPRPQKSLVGFAKVELRPGEEKEVQVQFGRSEAAYWDESVAAWRVTEGKYEVLVATSSHPEDCKVRLGMCVQEEFTFAA